MRLISIQTGTASPLLINGRSYLSAIRKTQQHQSVTLKPLGLVGDEQADLSVHGGLSKAVYAYPSEHYPFWGAGLAYGALGENLSLEGLLEEHAFVGDILQFADCALRITEPRQPCYKFNAVMQDPLASKRMAASGFCGFYLAVEQAGCLHVAESFSLRAGSRQTSIADLFEGKKRKAML